jgi:hypothetical protein
VRLAKPTAYRDAATKEFEPRPSGTFTRVAHYGRLGGVMKNRGTAAVYLAKAVEAEAMAAKFAKSFQKASWLDIARSYRDLAVSLQSVGGSESASHTSPEN